MIRQDLRFVNCMYNLYNYTICAVQQKQRDNLSRFSMRRECAKTQKNGGDYVLYFRRYSLGEQPAYLRKVLAKWLCDENPR